MRDDRRQAELSQVEQDLLAGDDFPGSDEVLALTRLVAELNHRVRELQENIDRLERRGGL